MASTAPPPLLHLGAASIVGRRRDHNEDAFGFGAAGGSLATASGAAASLAGAPPGVLLVVCDGVGGSNAGEVASALAVAALAESVGQARFAPESLLAAIRATDAIVRAKGAEHPGLRGMGATLTCVWIQDGRALWGQVGDSRAYRWRRRSGNRRAESAQPETRNSELETRAAESGRPAIGNRQSAIEIPSPLFHFTPEHTPVARLVRDGLLSPAQARKHRLRHVIDQALGGSPESFAPDAGELVVRPGDGFLLCSDGLTDGLDDAALATLLELHAHEPPAQLAQTLVAAANAASGRDNITALVLRVGEPPAAAPARSWFGWLTRWIQLGRRRIPPA